MKSKLKTAFAVRHQFSSYAYVDIKGVRQINQNTNRGYHCLLGLWVILFYFCVPIFFYHKHNFSLSSPNLLPLSPVSVPPPYSLLPNFSLSVCVCVFPSTWFQICINTCSTRIKEISPSCSRYNTLQPVNSDPELVLPFVSFIFGLLTSSSLSSTEWEWQDLPR